MAATVEKGFQESPVERTPGTDLKSRLTDHLSVQRKPGELLKITQVGPRTFRVNWMSPSTVTSDAMVMRTYKMTKSQFLLVEELGGELVITDKTVR